MPCYQNYARFLFNFLLFGLKCVDHFPCRKFETNTELTARNWQKIEVGVVLSKHVRNREAGFDSWPHHIKISKFEKNTELAARWAKKGSRRLNITLFGRPNPVTVSGEASNKKWEPVDTHLGRPLSRNILLCEFGHIPPAGPGGWYCRYWAVNLNDPY